MSDKPEPGSRFPLLIVGLGVASSLAVLFALRVFSQRSDGDSFVVSNDYLQVQQSVAIRNVRKEMAEEFVDTVMRCISPQILPSEILNEQQISERVMLVLANFSVPNESINNKKCGNDKSRAWTFTLPCKLTINRPPAWLSGTMNLGDINICGTTITASLRSATARCTASADFQACLVDSVVANNDVQKEIDKPVETQVKAQ